MVKKYECKIFSIEKQKKKIIKNSAVQDNKSVICVSFPKFLSKSLYILTFFQICKILYLVF